MDPSTEGIVIVVALNFLLFSVADYIEQRHPVRVAAFRRWFWGLFGLGVEGDER